MSSLIYNYAKKTINKGAGTDEFDWINDTIKVALVTSSYVPDASNHKYFSDITNEVTGTGYTAGGTALTSPTITQDNANNRAVYSAANTSWATATITARGAILYKSTGVAGTSPLIAYIDFGSDKSSVASTFLIAWSTNGIIIAQ